MKPEWWETFFSGQWLDAQRHAKAVIETYVEAEFIVKALGLTPQAKVLDVPCGEGRLSLELASRGYQLTGVDRTLPLLDDARRKAAERRLNILWEHRDMRELPWHEEFDGAFCFWGSFGYFDEAGNAAFAHAVARALKPGGRFLLDTHIVETVVPKFSERLWRRFGTTLALEEARYDHASSRVQSEWILVQAGKLERKPVSIRMYTYRELCRLLEEAGFTHFEGYGSLGQEPFQLGSPRLYLVATKKGA
jgi:SAM-dependent methyltransferase